jgi:putative nucleotidyltransferase with HDIG domain
MNMITEPKKMDPLVKKLMISQPIDIPVFHQVALRIQQLLQNSDYNVNDIVTIVNDDPSLASKMLTMANSAFNSGASLVTTIKEALVRLGSQQIINLAFTASNASQKSDNKIIDEHITKLWIHSHTVAVVSSWLAMVLQKDKKIRINVEETYLAGLLHDIGKLYLLKSMEKLDSAGVLKVDHITIDTVLFEIHVDQGVRVMEHWKIPAMYIDIAKNHHSLSWKMGTNQHMLAVIRLVNKLHLLSGSMIDETVMEIVDSELKFLDIQDVNPIVDMINTVK